MVLTNDVEGRDGLRPPSLQGGKGTQISMGEGITMVLQ